MRYLPLFCLVILVACHSTKQIAQKTEPEIIGHVTNNLIMAKPESPLGNWLADAIYTQATKDAGKTIDAVLIPDGFIQSTEIKAGNFTLQQLKALIPIDQPMVLVHLDSMNMVSLFLKSKRQGGWPMSQVTYQMYGGAFTALKVNNLTLRKKQTYLVAMPQGLADGGYDCAFLKTIERDPLPKTLRTMLLTHIRQLESDHKMMDGKYDGRVKVINN